MIVEESQVYEDIHFAVFTSTVFSNVLQLIKEDLRPRSPTGRMSYEIVLKIEYIC